MSIVKEQLKLFFANPVFIACIFSWLSAQLIKTLVKLFTKKIKTISELFELLFWRTGGMPSSHSSLVATLCTMIGFRSGIGSDVFFLSMGLFFITIRDALGVRRASGIQAGLINKIGKKLDEKGILKFEPIKEVHGHTPAEVFVGILLGFFIGLAFNVLK